MASTSDTSKTDKLAIAAGIDIGGTNTAIGLVDRSGQVLATQSLPTRSYPDPADFVHSVAGIACTLMERLDQEAELIGVGIGAPNGNHYKGTVEHAPNLQWKGVVPLANMFQEQLQRPVYLDNDANAATTGERIYGAAQGLDDFIMITLGTGVGSGLVANGKMIRGHDGFAGELGHTIVMPNGRTCGCGRKGCLETYVSATGVKRTIVERLSKSEDPSSLRKLQPAKITSKDIYDAAQAGDQVAQEAFLETGRILGLALSNAVAYTSPSTIVIFGGLAKAGPLLFDPTIEHFEENLLPVYKGKVRIIPSALPDFNAAILGASAMVWRRHPA
jgi:glucokinase